MFIIPLWIYIYIYIYFGCLYIIAFCSCLRFSPSLLKPVVVWFVQQLCRKWFSCCEFLSLCADLVAQKSPPSKVDDKVSPSAAGPGPSQPSAAAGSEATVDETTASAPEETTPHFQTIASRISKKSNRGQKCLLFTFSSIFNSSPQIFLPWKPSCQKK